MNREDRIRVSGFRVGDIVLCYESPRLATDARFFYAEIRGFDAGGTAIIAPWDEEEQEYSDLGMLWSYEYMLVIKRKPRGWKGWD